MTSSVPPHTASPPGPGGTGTPPPRSRAAAARRVFGATTLIAALGGCTLETEVGREVLDLEVVARIPPTFRHQLDLLFVVDDTTDMAAVQADTAAMWTRIRANLDYAEGGFPEVRIGVISSDLGVGAEAVVPGCDATGDAGALQPGADGTTWFDVDPYAPAASDALFAGRIQLGEAGCPFEQPLAAMRRALDSTQPANVGFLREAAALGVVFIAGDDDCSVADPAFFATGMKLDKFECFRDGVRCGGDDAVFIGEQSDCAPQQKSRFLVDVDDHAGFLLDLKKDPSSIMLAGVLGDPDQVEIVETKGGLSLSPACSGGNGGELYPGVRLGAFVGETWEDLTGRAGSVGGLCETTPEEAGGPAGLDLRRALGHRCLEGKLLDVMPDPGVQVACEVHAVDAEGARRKIDACPNPNHVFDEEGPCFAIKPGPSECGDFPTQLALQVNWGGANRMTTPAGVTTEVSCVVDDDSMPD